METVHQLIGVDVGQVRSGLAIASDAARLAQPLKSVATKELIPTLQELTSKEPVEALVVGLPRNLEGKDTPQTKWVRQWADRAKKQIKRPFYWQDEALTSHQAAVRFKKTPVDIDAEAAAIILQDFLDTPKSERVIC